MSTLLESYVYNNSQGTDSVVEALTEGNNNLANVLTQLVQIHTKQGQIDASLNQNQTILTNNQSNLITVSANSQIVLDKVNKILESVVADTSGNTLSKVLTNIDATQKSLIEQIGQYLVIPLYEQRMNDISTFYLAKLEDNVIPRLERYLVLFREEKFADLVLEFTQEKCDEMSNLVHDIKRQAFIKYISLTPGATCFEDLTQEAQKSYRFFRKYTSNFFKTLDGLMRCVRLYQKYLNTQGELEMMELDSEILNDPEKLKIYLEQLRESQKKNVSLFETTVTLDLPQLNLKPEYMEYIKRYGLPAGWLFEAEKMAGVIKDLIDMGVISDPGSEKIVTSSGLSGNSSEETTDNDPNDLTATATDTATDTHSSCDDMEQGEASDYSFSENEYSDYEQDSNNTTTTWFIYVSSDSDPNHVVDTYYYPLYLTSLEAAKAVDVSGVPDPNVDVAGNQYTSNDAIEPTGIKSMSFTHLPNVTFWQPNSHPYRAFGTDYFPPSSLEYTHYTTLTNTYN